MAIKLPDFLKAFTGSGAKSRIFIVLAAVAAVAILIFIGTRFMEGGAGAVGPSKVAQAPAGLQSVPGAKMSPEFYRAVEQANAQSAQQAQISGGSAVPTLLNIPSEVAAQTSSGCCNSDNVDVSDEINNLVKTGKMTQEDADRLLALAKNNVTVEEYAAALNDLVRQGKLSPEEARRLLDCYKKQHQNRLAAETAGTTDAMIKAGTLPLDAASQLAALRKSGISVADYAQELDRMVKAGLISPQAAAQLLAQYTQQQEQEQAKAAIFKLQQMAKTGQISADAAATLAALQKQGVSVDDYAAALNRLVAEGKMTPEAAAKLLDQYKRQHGLTTTGSPAISAGLSSAQSDETQCQATLSELLKAKKITADDAKKLSDKCQKMTAIKNEYQHLADMQNKGVTLAEFLAELKRAVKMGLLTPGQAGTLLQEYRTMLAAKSGATMAPPPSNISGAEQFAKLQQRVQAGQPAAEAQPVETEQFQVATSEGNAQAEQERRQRIELLMNAMSTQAQQLVTAWQPPNMAHQGGIEEKSSKSSDKGTTGGEGNGPGAGPNSGPNSASGNPIIKAGTILFAVLDTGINSDFPDSPVMATIIQGDFKGGKVLGKVSVVTSVQGQQQDKVTLSFNIMNMDSWSKSRSVTAFAIDPDTARTALASNVDYHYLKRYGALFAGSFLSGYAQAIMQAGSQTTISTTGTTTTSPPLSPKSKIAMGFGKIGTALATAVQDSVNIPPTVVVNSGVGLGILFMADVS